MGQGRQWLQAVITAVAICLLSKYANANMDAWHTFTMHLHNLFLLVSFSRFSAILQAFIGDELSQLKSALECFFRKLLTKC